MAAAARITEKTSPKDVAAWLARKLKSDQAERPKAQARGAFRKGPRAYVECAKCTRMFADPKRPGLTVGVPKQHARQHARNHQLGLVRRPAVSA